MKGYLKQFSHFLDSLDKTLGAVKGLLADHEKRINKLENESKIVQGLIFLLFFVLIGYIVISSC